MASCESEERDVVTEGDPGVPRVPPHFRAVRLLGQGSTAVTWLAHYEITGQDVALKVWRSPFACQTDKDRFVNECRWHRLLDGERGIVGWIWASEPDLEHPWTATQPHGLALTEYLRRYRISPEQAVRLSLDLLDGLSAVHRRGLVHRDINPNNVLVDDDGAALCDFGLAMPVDGTTLDRAAGTPGFVAPELDVEAPGFRSDVYSAAQTIARLLTPDVPAAIDHLVTAVAGSSRPSDRPADAAEFARRLRVATEHMLASREADPVPDTAPVPDTVAAPPGPAGMPAATRRGRQRGRALAGVGGAVACAVLAAVLVPWSWLSGGAGSGGERVVVSAPSTSSAVRTSGPSAVRSSPARPSAVRSSTTATPVMAADVGPNGEPMLGPARPPGRCDGRLRSTEELKSPAGAVVGTIKVYEDSGGTMCAKFFKAAGPLRKVKTYLALTVCNPQGRCDKDWNLYLQDAGPLRVSAPSGCLRWRVSATDVDGETWLLRDRTGASGC